MKYTIGEAIDIIREIEPKLASRGIHTALTGSTLYKGESEKDFDILLYPHKSEKTPNISEVRDILHEIGFVPFQQLGGSGAHGTETGRVVDIMEYKGKRVDIFLDSFLKPCQSEPIGDEPF